ncbi:dTDP-4-dehydrorhamnose 3,5-epimerase family protein [Vogesella fluminis]|uniref:dTDP-4-dehydrorhamnose 3,5-epimerase n=1 Tax=Vogesella fluminis TaxID=1069161 RepID=A0ABQ3HEU7_9NEIS|nr:hypothetical protein GCM10011419_20530 [Vogesella fluminis]
MLLYEQSYSLPHYTQGKLVYSFLGEVPDVTVDIHKSYSTFEQWVGVSLSAKNKRQLWIPEGFAHRFLTLADAEVFFV